ncbi:MAG: hypothetical protein U0835_19595 [Isosphaeraceae bacterium]
MTLSRPESWLRTPAAALLALCVVGVFAPGRAEAGCSHFVIWKGDAPRSLAELEILAPQGLGAEAKPGQSPAPGIPGERRGPCTGALCSGSPAPLVPASDVPPPSHESCLTVEEAAPPVASALALAISDDLARPVICGLGIFHPPRLPLA